MRRSSNTLPISILLLVWGLYALLQFSSLWFHEPWSDEVQAWLIARDSGLWELFSERLRYEVTPGLWHLILWIAARFTQDVMVVNLASVLVSCITSAIILFASPFPWAIRVALPFTYFLGYQYSIVARNYCLTSLGVALIAVTYQERLKRPWLYVISLIFLAQSSAHGILIAGGIALCDLFPLRNLGEKRALVRLTPVFVLGILLALVQIIPRPIDYIIRQPPQGGGGIIYSNLTVWTCWDESLLGYPVLSILVGILSLVLFYRSRTLLLYLVPTTLLMLLFAYGHWTYWHTGNLFLIWFFCLWQSYVQNPKATEKYWWRATIWLLLIVQITQTAWTVERDFYEPYCGLQAAAIDAKHRHIPLKDIYLEGYYGSMLRAYYPAVPGHPGYYLWSTAPGANKYLQSSPPPYLLVTVGIADNGFTVGEYPGYSVVQVYPGFRPWKGKVIYLFGSLALLKKDEPNKH